MPQGEISRTRRTANAWATTFGITLIIWSASQAVGAWYGGLGVGYEEGRYLMRQGVTTAEINQTLGLGLYVIDRLWMLAMLVFLLLTAIMSLQNRRLGRKSLREVRGNVSASVVRFVWFAGATIPLAFSVFFIRMLFGRRGLG